MPDQEKSKKEEVQTISDSLAKRQSQLATVLIGVLVIIAGFLTYNYFKATRTAEVTTDQVRTEDLLGDTGEGDSLEEILTEGEEEGTVQGQYTVQTGDSLWNIAETQLGGGELWRELAMFNNISTDNPTLEVGQVLQLPEIVRAEETTEETTPGDVGETAALIEETPETAASPETYVVQHGDTLWEIAEEFYGDGARWREIFDANPLSMYQADGRTFPLIHAGNVLVIP